MGILDSISNGIKNHFDKKQQDREMMERLRKEAEMQERLHFEQEFRKNSLEVAKRKALQDAARLSGLQKLRATNRARRLTESGQGEGFLSKLSSHTQRNIASREENLKRTAEMRATAKKMREERMAKRFADRQQRMSGRKPFGQSTWRK